MLIWFIAITFLFPLGSDIGVQGIFNWVVGLLVIPTTICISAFKDKKPIYVMFACTALAAIIRMSCFAYGDNTPRWKSTYTIKSARLNVLCSEQKANNLNVAISCIEKYKGGSNLLLLGNQESALYYATQTYPFIGHTQPIVYSGNGKYEERLNDRLKYHHNQYPLICLLDQDDSSETIGNQLIIRRWAKKHGYKSVYNDGYVEIMKK